MNNLSLDSALELIAHDCEIMGLLMDEEGRTCAVGCLAKALGVPDEELIAKADSEEVRGIVNSWLRVTADALDVELFIDAGDVMTVNDSCSIIDERRERIRTVLLNAFRF